MERLQRTIDRGALLLHDAALEEQLLLVRVERLKLELDHPQLVGLCRDRLHLKSPGGLANAERLHRRAQSPRRVRVATGVSEAEAVAPEYVCVREYNVYILRKLQKPGHLSILCVREYNVYILRKLQKPSHLASSNSASTSFASACSACAALCAASAAGPLAAFFFSASSTADSATEGAAVPASRRRTTTRQ